MGTEKKENANTHPTGRAIDVQCSRYHPVHRDLPTTASTGTARQRFAPDPRPVSGANRHGLRLHGAVQPVTQRAYPTGFVTPRASTMPRFAASVPLRPHPRPRHAGLEKPRRRHTMVQRRLPPASLASRPTGAGVGTVAARRARCWLPGFNGPVTLHHSGYEPHSLVTPKHSSGTAPPSSSGTLFPSREYPCHRMHHARRATNSPSSPFYRCAVRDTHQGRSRR